MKTQIFCGDVLLVEWAAGSSINRVDDGVDTSGFHDGMILVQIFRYTARPKD